MVERPKVVSRLHDIVHRGGARKRSSVKNLDSLVVRQGRTLNPVRVIGKVALSNFIDIAVYMVVTLENKRLEQRPVHPVPHHDSYEYGSIKQV